MKFTIRVCGYSPDFGQERNKGQIDEYIEQQAKSVFSHPDYCPVELIGIHDLKGVKRLSRCFCGRYLGEDGNHRE